MNKDITPLRIKINIWQKVNDKNKFMVLYENQIPFSLSETSMTEWNIFYSFTAFNPLVPPYKDGTQLFRARHSKKYPYELLEIVPVMDIFTIREPGTYFVAYTASYDNTNKLPFDNMLIYVENGLKLTPPPSKVYFF